MGYHVCFDGLDLVGTVSLPASKSLSNRLLMLRQLSQASMPIVGLSDAVDTQVLVSALHNGNTHIDVRDAGTAMRFLTAYLASLDNGLCYTLGGSERLCERPIGVLVSALQQLGAEVAYVGKTACPPLRIKAVGLHGGSLQIDASVSSQYISALLMIAPTLEHGLELLLEGQQVSESYVAMTVALMQQFGVSVATHSHPHRLVVAPQKYRPPLQPMVVEADWSAASYFYGMAVLCAAAGGRCDLCLQGLQRNSTQGDQAMVAIAESLGIATTYHQQGVWLRNIAGFKAHTSLPLHANLLHYPDLTQTIAVLCAGLGKSARLQGLQTLAIKETDRTAALQHELAKIGVTFTKQHNEQTAHSWTLEAAHNAPPHDAIPTFATYNDHRMAMSLCMLAMCRKQGVRIEQPQVVAKSFPLFWQQLAGLGCRITEYEPDGIM